MELGHLEHLVSEQAGDRCATGVSEKRCYERRVPTDSHRSSVTMCRVPDYRIVMHCLYLQANLRPFMQRFIKGESPSASLLGLLGLPQQSPRKTAPVNLPPAPHVPIGASPGTVVGDLPRLQQQHLVEAREDRLGGLMDRGHHRAALLANLLHVPHQGIGHPRCGKGSKFEKHPISQEKDLSIQCLERPRTSASLKKR